MSVLLGAHRVYFYGKSYSSDPSVHCQFIARPGITNEPWWNMPIMPRSEHGKYALQEGISTSLKLMNTARLTFLLNLIAIEYYKKELIFHLSPPSTIKKKS